MKDRQYNGKKMKDRQYNGQKGQTMTYKTLHRKVIACHDITK